MRNGSPGINLPGVLKGVTFRSSRVRTLATGVRGSLQKWKHEQGPNADLSYTINLHPITQRITHNS